MTNHTAACLLGCLFAVAGCATGGGGRPIAPSPRPKAASLPEPAPKNFPPVTRAPLRLATGHPRCVFRPTAGRTFRHVRDLYRTDATFRAIADKALAVPEARQTPASLAACWILTGDDHFAAAAVARMTAGQPTATANGAYSNLWDWALAYDWLFDHPALSSNRRDAIAARIRRRLAAELDWLDTDSMALWHGRNQAANGAMIAALALGDRPGREQFLRRAAAHYIESLRALQFSGGWPEGASYWIYNRAGPYALAADCAITALGADTLDGIPIRDVMRTIGYWQLYQYGPNGIFEPYGDSAGSLRLGETGWWELTTDHYARLSRDPGLMAGADYLRNRSPDAYGRRPYYWNVVMTYEPSARPTDGYDPAQPELWMRAHLPQAMLFGRDSLGVAFFRTRWGDPDETFASFKAGDLLAHHDHYDCGNFTIFKAAPLVMQTGLYGDYFGVHRLGYMVQTVSANSLLILAPGEFSNYLRSGKQFRYDALAGGQRVIRPTSFNCVSVDHFRRQLDAGPHLERGGITAWRSVAGQYDYVAADLTAAYNSTVWAEPGNAAKVSRVTRQFVYLRPEQAFVIFDRVDTTDAKYLPKFLLHGWTRPASETETQLVGTPDNGIAATADRELVTTDGRGRLTHRVLLPADARTLKIGGPDYRCYVEADGDQADGFDGINLDKKGRGAARGGNTNLGLWRTETEPTRPTRHARFCNVLLPRLADDAPLPAVELLDAGEGVVAVRAGATAVVFSADDKPLSVASVKAPGAERTYVFPQKIPPQ